MSTIRDRKVVFIDHELIGRITKLLKEDSRTIEEVSNELEISRITASKYLAILEATEIIKCRPVGNAKLFSVVKK